MRLYKAQVFSCLESETPDVYHAACATMGKLNCVQRRFLRNIGVAELEALAEYRLAPVMARRDIAIRKLLIARSNATSGGRVIHRWRLKQYDPHTRSFATIHGMQLAEYGSCEAAQTFSNAQALVLWRSGTRRNTVNTQSTKLWQRTLQQTLIKTNLA